MRCVIEGCDRKASTRGLCRSCYMTALRAVIAGEVTWDLLEHANPPLAGPLMKHPNAFAAQYAQFIRKHQDLPGQTMLFGEVHDALQEKTNEVPNS
jgi:hypothetical protein